MSKPRRRKRGRATSIKERDVVKLLARELEQSKVPADTIKQATRVQHHHRGEPRVMTLWCQRALGRGFVLRLLSVEARAHAQSPKICPEVFAARSRPARGFIPMSMKLKTTIARNLELPSGKTDHIEWDEDFPGFGVRLRAGRNRISRMWIYQYDIAGRTRRITIGNANAIGIEEAHKIAGQLQGKVRLGSDPAQEKAEKIERATHTFGNVLKDFLMVQKRTTRWGTYRATNSFLGVDFCSSLHPMSLGAITRRNIANVLTPLAVRGVPAQHNNVRNKLTTFFNWAIKQGLIEHSPMRSTEKLEQKSRQRVLSMDEFVAVSRTLDAMTDYFTYIHLLKLTGQRQNEEPIAFWRDGLVDSMTDYRDMMRLLMLTGCRRAEISELLWSEIRTEKIFIDDGLPVAGPAIVLPSERVKNGRKFVVPLSAPAIAILSSRRRDPDKTLVFPRKFDIPATFSRAWSRHKKLLDTALAERGHKLEHWVLHDIRRSVATHMGHMGIQPHVIEEALNHFRANVYNKSKLEGPKRHAVEAWGEYLMAHVEGREPATPVNNVVPLRA
jgi:integrase